jgi:hypothetical protein
MVHRPAHVRSELHEPARTDVYGARFLPRDLWEAVELWIAAFVLWPFSMFHKEMNTARDSRISIFWDVFYGIKQP